ncbi:unnamed protein product [Prorocentrum cordatum]|uniref:CFAP65 seventh Ig-like domain-containing protein n=1 Tax=Prorocentrum cordatum TaxID=2364126 RepID=A0ABN9X2H9_9DINO|nr:unnamed protein product [Polarella glacialis]
MFADGSTADPIVSVRAKAGWRLAQASLGKRLSWPTAKFEMTMNCQDRAVAIPIAPCSDCLLCPGFVAGGRRSPEVPGLSCRAPRACGLPLSSGISSKRAPPEVPLMLSAAADARRIQCDTTQIKFANTVMFNTKVHRFTVRNLSCISVPFQWHVEGEHGHAYAVEPAAGAVPPSAELQVAVRFAPVEVEDFGATLVCTSSAAADAGKPPEILRSKEEAEEKFEARPHRLRALPSAAAAPRGLSSAVAAAGAPRGGGPSGFIAEEYYKNEFGTPFNSWAALSNETCEPWKVPYGLSRLRGAAGDAARLVFTRMPATYWATMQHLSQDLDSTASAVSSGRALRRSDIARLANALASAADANEQGRWYLQEARRLDQMPSDVALRLARALGNVESHARFLFAAAFPCSRDAPHIPYREENHHYVVYPGGPEAAKTHEERRLAQDLKNFEWASMRADPGELRDFL